jgi:hypothetical protein
MLVASLKHEKTFEELSFQDQKYVNELTKKGKGVPTQDDWKYIGVILPFWTQVKKGEVPIQFCFIPHLYQNDTKFCWHLTQIKTTACNCLICKVML